jgi:murein DD-endopeptidase MepM/ murein hydrolase activator NlpD
MSQKCDKVKWILLKLNIDEKKNMEDYNVMKKWLFGGIGIMLLIILMGFTVADFAGNGLMNKQISKSESSTVDQEKQVFNNDYYEDSKAENKESIELIYELSVDDKIYYFESEDEIEQVLTKVVELSTENTKDIKVTIDGENVNIDFEAIPTLSAEIAERNFVMAGPNPTYTRNNEIVNDVSYEPSEVLAKLDFNEKVIVESVVKDSQNISNVTNVVEELLRLNSEPAEYTIESGDSASLIAEKNEMSLLELYELNPWLEKREKTLQIGEKLVVEKLIPELSIVNCYKATEINSIPPEVVYQEDNAIYSGLTVIAEEGEEGKELLKMDVDIVNDEIVNESIMESLVVTEPVSQLVLIGTAPVPEDGPAGFFVTPLNYYRLTSSYGPRWGKTHRGLDMAVSSGTTVKASDGGQVIFAGWDNAYGYRVDIDHGNGITTRYAHNSKLLVEYGEVVGQGETIAKSGNTGNSTGPHLHFEVIVDGNAVNPYDYIG